MGFDFSNHQLFAGNDPRRFRAAVIDRLKGLLREDGFCEVPDEENADRSFVVGPPERWIHLGDSSGSTEWADREAFDGLSAALSVFGPLVDIQMSDSVVVHLSLYRNGQLIDRFGNGSFPWNAFPTEDEAEAFHGKPELWADLLLDPGSAGALRSAWVQGWAPGASAILAATAKLLGWNPGFSGLGYTVFDEADEIKYTGFLRPAEFAPGAFTELHFRKD